MVLKRLLKYEQTLSSNDKQLVQSWMDEGVAVVPTAAIASIAESICL